MVGKVKVGRGGGQDCNVMVRTITGHTGVRVSHFRKGVALSEVNHETFLHYQPLSRAY